MKYAVYGYGSNYSQMLLVTDSFWVVNGDWQFEKENGVFLHPMNKTPIDLKLLGHIDYDGDYNSTLYRFSNGEGQHIKNEVKPVVIVEAVAVPEPELCKKKYYGLTDCTCSKCRK